MQKWEYIILQRIPDDPDIGDEDEEAIIAQKMAARVFHWIDNKDDERRAGERLNELGQEGWELVSAYSPGGGAHIFLLKRPIE